MKPNLSKPIMLSLETQRELAAGLPGENILRGGPPSETAPGFLPLTNPAQEVYGHETQRVPFLRLCSSRFRLNGFAKTQRVRLKSVSENWPLRFWAFGESGIGDRDALPFKAGIQLLLEMVTYGGFRLSGTLSSSTR